MHNHWALAHFDFLLAEALFPSGFSSQIHFITITVVNISWPKSSLVLYVTTNSTVVYLHRECRVPGHTTINEEGPLTVHISALMWYLAAGQRGVSKK